MFFVTKLALVTCAFYIGIVALLECVLIFGVREFEYAFTPLSAGICFGVLFVLTKLALITSGFYIAIVLLIQLAMMIVAVKWGLGIRMRLFPWTVFFGVIWLVSFFATVMTTRHHL